MKRKGKFSLIEIPVYNIDIAISVDQDLESLRKSLLKTWNIPTEFLPDSEMPEGVNAAVLRRRFGDVWIPYCIRFNNFKWDYVPDQICTLSHEALHITFSILKTRGIELTYETEEAYTYLQGHITREIFKHL